MVQQSIIPKCLLPFNSVRLGRFILNTKQPNQDFMDPPCSPPPADQITTLSLHNWQEILTSSRATQLRNRLTSLLNFGVSNASKNHTGLSALKATTYTLENSKNWFNQGIASPEVRKWLEAAIEEGTPAAYLVVGFHTLSDAKYEKDVTSGGEFGLDSTVSMPQPEESGSGLVGGVNLTATIGGGIQRERRHQSGFEVPGEQIYAVQYRKLKFKWYSSKSLQNGFLEANNRWKVYWDVRGDDEQDDVLELVYAEESDNENAELNDDDSTDEDSDEEQEEVNTYEMENSGVEYVF